MTTDAGCHWVRDFCISAELWEKLDCVMAPNRPLTLPELEALHDSTPPPDHIPGLPQRMPWGRLLVVAILCGAVGFALALLWYQLGTG